MGGQTDIELTDGRRCTLRHFAGQGAGLAVILPGLNYSCELPLLAGVSGLLKERDHHVVEVSFGYSDDTGFRELPDEAQVSAIEIDGCAILAHVRGMHESGPLLLVGKSLGSVALGGMIKGGLPDRSRIVWLTPSLTGTSLIDHMKAANRPAISLIGSRDRSVEITRSADYRSIAKLAHVEVPGMDHGWQNPDGEAATRKGLFVALAVIGNWLDSSAQLDKPGFL